MNRTQARIGLIAFFAVLLAFVLWPALRTFLYSAQEPRPVEARGDLPAGERLTIELFERVSPSVVHVFAGSGRAPIRDAEEPQGQQTGTGFVWDGAGHIVTNNHVVENASSILVRLANGQIHPARIVGRAPNVDLAVIRLQSAPTLPPPIPVGTSSDLKVGQMVLAIGNPFGLDQTLTVGVISAVRRRLPTEQGREIADVIQTDAAINPGNSGGPLVDSAGRLIGVNTAIYSPSGASAGIGFAVPVDTVNRIAPQLIRDGRVPTPAIGVSLAPEGAAARFGLDGLIVIAVAPGSPAERAGMRGVDRATGELGDIIIAINDRPVRRLADLAGALEAQGVGGTVAVTVLRQGRPETLQVGIADGGARGGR